MKATSRRFAGVVMALVIGLNLGLTACGAETGGSSPGGSNTHLDTADPNNRPPCPKGKREGPKKTCVKKSKPCPKGKHRGPFNACVENRKSR